MSNSRFRRAGGPPPGAPGGYSPELVQATMPDYPVCRRTLYKLDLFFALISVLVELLYFLLLCAQGQLGPAKGEYLIWNLTVPTVLNAAILSVIHVIRKRVPEKVVPVQNALPVFAMEFMCWNVCITHSIRPVTLALLFIPVCMTTLFADKRGCIIISLFSATGICAASVRRAVIAAGGVGYAEIALEAFTVLLGLLMLSLSAMAVLRMTEGQKNKLFNFFYNSKAAQAGAEAAQAKAEAANMAKSEFLANMSHEIRTPINAILGMNEMVLRESRDEQIVEYATNIRSASTSLLSLINDVLDFSKIESGKLEIVEIHYDTASFLHNCYTMVSERAAKKGLQFDVDISPEIPVQLKGDEIRMRQVVTNLLSNAVKYTEKGTISLSAAGVREGERVLLTVTVKDTGIGIKEDNLNSMFAQFARLDMQRNRTIEGAGLGLAITKQLVDLMHGEIKVQSIYGIGSSFSVTIPQEIVDASPMGDFHKRYQDISQKDARYQKSFDAPSARILVVDDVEVNLKVVSNLLKATHIRVDTAISGFQCLEMTAQQHYDMIFLDHMMPEMDGIETYKRLKAQSGSPNRETPVIMLTANAVTGVKEQYLAEGFTDYLSKPVSGAKLEATILKYLPENMVRELHAGPEAGDGPEEPQNDNLTRLQALFQACPDVDIGEGMSQCAESSEVYLDVLRTFARSMKLQEIEACFANRDAANYCILVHGVKSAAKSAGFLSLSDQALALETASREEDWPQIERLHAGFCEAYRKAGEAISSTIVKENFKKPL